MDPLSIAASALAIFGAAEKVPHTPVALFPALEL